MSNDDAPAHTDPGLRTPGPGPTHVAPPLRTMYMLSVLLWVANERRVVCDAAGGEADAGGGVVLAWCAVAARRLGERETRCARERGTPPKRRMGRRTSSQELNRW